MSFPCKRDAIFRKTRDRSRSEIFMQKGVEMPQQIEPGWQKKIQGACTKTAQASKYDFRRDRCVFRKSASRLHGKLIFEVSAIHLDGNTSPGAISGSVLFFCLMQKTQHRVGDCSRRGFATQIEARGPENRLPVQAARRFRKSTRSGTLSRNGCPTDPRKRPRVRQTISKETQNQPKVLSRVTLEARWTPSFPETPQRPSHETILSLKMSSGTILPPIWNMF